jgi:hypothetical protein
MKVAMKALRDAEVPESLWATALPLALADLRRDERASSVVAEERSSGDSSPRPPKPTGKRARKSNGAQRPSPASVESAVLAELPDEKVLFESVARETGVSEADLGDLFHVENGRLEVKAPGRDLGASKKAGSQTIAALLGGVVFAGTSHRKLPFKEIADVCKAKHAFDSNNSASYLKSTPGFTSVGTGSAQALTSRTGWQGEFLKAVNRTLKKPQPEAS